MLDLVRFQQLLVSMSAHLDTVRIQRPRNLVLSISAIEQTHSQIVHGSVSDVEAFTVLSFVFSFLLNHSKMILTAICGTELPPQCRREEGNHDGAAEVNDLLGACLGLESTPGS